MMVEHSGNTNQRARRSASGRLRLGGLPAVHGFTLVELLVVITIITLLVGLLTPAILAARERSRRTGCENRQRDLGKAVTSYELAKQQFPGYANRTPGPTAEASWIVMLLSGLDRNDLWDEWRTGNPAALANVRIGRLICPSDDPSEPGATSYVANCGQADEVVELEDMPSAAPLNKNPPDWNANGVFHRYYAQPSAPRTVMTTQIAMTDIKDGAGHTLLLSENIQAGQWASFNTAAVPPTPLPIMERAVGMIWCPHEEEPGHAHIAHGGINAGLDVDSSDPNFPKLLYARPSSYHAGGVNVVFCDGHTQFLNQQIDYEVFQLLMTPDGAKAQMYESGAWERAPQTKTLDEKMLLTD